jgi:hypothetical protein
MNEPSKFKPFTIPVASDEKIQSLLTQFWLHGGKDSYEASLEARRANGIPDKQWFSAQLMSIIDDAEITYNDGNDTGK